MSKTCDKCAHYDAEGSNCDCPKFVYSGRQGSADADGLEYWDYEGYSAGFNVGPKFGCIHWIKKEPQ